MPEKQTVEKAEKAKRQGKAPTTQAGEFVREEMHHVREGKHGARSATSGRDWPFQGAPRRSGTSAPREGNDFGENAAWCPTCPEAFPVPNQTVSEAGRRRAFGSAARRARRSFQICTGAAGALCSTEARVWIVEGSRAESRAYKGTSRPRRCGAQGRA